MSGRPYSACPYSLEPDELGDIHPHQAGEWYDNGRRRCAVCEREIRGALRSGVPIPPPPEKGEWTYRREDGSIYIPPDQRERMRLRSEWAALDEKDREAALRAEFRARMAPILAAVPVEEP